MATAPRVFYSVQVLRGLAALAVVLYHGGLAASEDHLGPIFSLKGGEAGVDLFFAISGFVMVTSTARFWGDLTTWRIFLLRRLIRIVPLYWIFTLLKIASVVFFSGVILHSVLDGRLIFSSFLFLPVWNPGHDAVVPILPVGWTLCYEMFFYLLFALSLGLAKRPMLLLFPLLAGLAGLGLLRTASWGAPATLIDPILLEFIFGMSIALAVRSKIFLPRFVIWILVPVMILILAASPYLQFDGALAKLCGVDNKDIFRPLIYGVPGALLLYAAVSLQTSAVPWFGGFFRLMGDASYSIYLSHGFVIPPLTAAWQKWHWMGSLSACALIVACLMVSIIVGVGIHAFLENPLLHFLNRKVHQPDPVGIRVER